MSALVEVVALVMPLGAVVAEAVAVAVLDTVPALTSVCVIWCKSHRKCKYIGI